MKVKKEIEVDACDLCGEELELIDKIFDVFLNEGSEHYVSHVMCVEHLVLETIEKKIIKKRD